jgi:hypothetical protein
LSFELTPALVRVRKFETHNAKLNTAVGLHRSIDPKRRLRRRTP